MLRHEGCPQTCPDIGLDIYPDMAGHGARGQVRSGRLYSRFGAGLAESILFRMGSL